MTLDTPKQGEETRQGQDAGRGGEEGLLKIRDLQDRGDKVCIT